MSTERIPDVPSVRLSLDQSGSRTGMLDGAWWPRSRDPARELVPLITELDGATGTVFRIGLNRATWDSHPRRVTAHGHVVKLGWYGPADANAVRIFGEHREHLDLLMVPPGADASSAAAAMVTASDSTSQARATEVLTKHGISTDGTAQPGVTAARPPRAEPRTAPLAELTMNGATRQNGTRPHGIKPPNGISKGEPT